ncbi:Biorientation of chromosomes in cell division protein 1 [Eumeta japonica]|uniref:Biorientation of chromosomes in cell division protein 1 n=1 Tax=Eumeta variegata TaxID=151549 RepID=A0A4C1ZXP3_EUMVA|nr:Biorientation of chromosomes in cell division protein 1 [Eumeta japonica]
MEGIGKHCCINFSTFLERGIERDSESACVALERMRVVYLLQASFRKECISDVDTRPAYQNLRQRVESSVATFLSHQLWKPDLNKNQLREKLRKHLLE